MSHKVTRVNAIAQVCATRTLGMLLSSLTTGWSSHLLRNCPTLACSTRLFRWRAYRCLCSRSSDLQTLWFGERQNGKTLEFLFDADSVLTGVKIRYFNPKTGRYLAFSSGFTAWETFLVDGNYPPQLDLATVLYALHQRVVLRGDTPETPSVFLSVRKGDGLQDRPKGLYHALKADTLASRMKSVMLKSGVPADFKPHSARAAGGALLKTKG